MGLSEAGVKLVAQGSSAFNSSIERAHRAVSDFGNNAGSAGAGGLERMSLATIALGNALGTLAVQGLNAAANALTNFISKGWNYGATIDSATVSLTNFLGSQEAANEALAMAERRASRTPFAFEDYARSLGSVAAIQKSNGGELEDYLDLIERLASANPAEGFQGATFALRQAFSGDFLSLQDRFDIPKDTIAKLKEAGFSVESLDRELAELGFTSELVAKQGETLEGRWSTLMDMFTTSAGTFMEPIRNAIAEGIFGLSGALDANLPDIQAKLASAGQFVADAITSFRQGWEGGWVDSDIIQPAHRVAGVLGTNVRQAFVDVKLAVDNFNTAVQTAKDAWNNPWLQENVLAPLAELGRQIREDFITDWNNLGVEWEDLNTAGLAFNELMSAGRELWSTAVGLFEQLGFKMADMNIPQSEAVTLGEHLVIVFKAMTKVAGIASIGLNLIATGLQQVWIWAIQAEQAYKNFLNTAAGIVGEAIDIAITGDDHVPPKGNPGGTVPKVMAPVVPSAPPGAGGRGQTTHNTTIVVPPGTSPAVATAIVADGYQRALRSQGLA